MQIAARDLVAFHRRQIKNLWIADRSKLEISRQDADYNSVASTIAVIELQHSAEDVGLTSHFLPERIAEHNQAGLRGMLIGWTEQPSQRGTHAKRREEIAGDHPFRYQLRLSPVENPAVLRVTSHRFEDRVLRFPIEIVWVRGFHLAELAAFGHRDAD